MEVMALDVAIRAPGGDETIRTLTDIEGAGKRTAAGLTGSFSKASQAIIDEIMKTGSAAAKASLQAQLDAQRGAEKKVSALTAAEIRLSANFAQQRQREITSAETAAHRIEALNQKRVTAAMVAESRLAAHFRQMRQQELNAAEVAAHAHDATLKVVNKGVVSYQKWGNAALRASGAVMLMADAATDSDKSFQKMLRTGSAIAFMFGPTGAIVGAVGIMASMVIGAFDNSRKAIDAATEAAKKFGDELKAIRVATDIGGLMGKAALNDAKIQEKQAEVDEAQRKVNAAIRAETAAATEAQFSARRAATVEAKQLLATLKEALIPLEQERVAINETVASLAQSEQAYRDDTAAVEANTKAHEEAVKRRAAAALQFGKDWSAFNLPGAVGAAKIGGLNQRPGPVTAIANQGLTEGQRKEQGAGFAELRVKTEEEAAKEFKALQDNIASLVDTHIVGGIGNALHAGFTAAFSGGGIGGLIKGFGSGILSGLGDFFSQMGQYLVKFGITMEIVKRGLTNPFTSGPAAIAAGVALIALGAAMGALGARAGGTSGAGSYASSAAQGGRALVDQSTTYRYNPQTSDMTKVNPVAPVHFTIIGQNDVDAQNRIADMVVKAQRRGGGRA